MTGNETAPPSPDVPAARPDGDVRALNRELSNRHIQLIAIGGAIGTGLFMGSGKAISLAGPSLLLAYLIIGLMLFFVMRAMGEMFLHDLRFKSFQDFSREMIGPWAGFFTGWTYWVLWVVTAAAEMLAIIGYFDFWIGNLNVSMICTAALLLALLGSNLLTVKLFGELEFWFALIKIIAIIALILVGAYMVTTGFTSPDGTVASVTYLWSHGGVFPTGLTGFLAAFQLAIFSFIGTELIGTAAAETADPHKTLPKAINAIPVRIIIFYVLALAAIMAVTPWDRVSPEMSPFVNVFNLAGLVAAASVMNFVVLTSASSSSNSGIFSTSRMLYGLADTGYASKRFARLSGRHVPANALVLSGALVFIAFPVLKIGGTVMRAFQLISSVSSILVLFIWSLIMVAYIMYRRKFPQAHAQASFRVPGAVFMPWVVLVFFLGMIAILALDEETRVALVLTPLWFIALAVVWRLRFAGRPAVVKTPAAAAD